MRDLGCHRQTIGLSKTTTHALLPVSYKQVVFLINLLFI